jgi:hypothetical protein
MMIEAIAAQLFKYLTVVEAVKLCAQTIWQRCKKHYCCERQLMIARDLCL